MKLCIASLLFFAACQTTAGSGASNSSLVPAHLRCEYKSEPLGIGTSAPHLDWRVEAVDPSARGLAQSAWQILVASDQGQLARDHGDLWDSGKVASASTSDIAYGGAPLAFGSVAHWKVRVWDQVGRTSAWSSPASFSIGPLAAGDWSAQWIGFDAPLAKADQRPTLAGAHWIWSAGDDAKNAPECERWFRCRFQIPAGVDVHAARLLVSVDNFCEVFVDGEHVGGNADEIDGWRHGLALDVGPRLHSGENVIAIEAKNASQGAAGVIARLVVNPGASNELVVTSGTNWRASATAADGWSASQFDDSAWALAADVGKYGSDPWGDVMPAGLVLPPPRLLRKEFSIAKSVRRATVYASALGLFQLQVKERQVGTPGSLRKRGGDVRPSFKG